MPGIVGVLCSIVFSPCYIILLLNYTRLLTYTMCFVKIHVMPYCVINVSLFTLSYYKAKEARHLCLYGGDQSKCDSLLYNSFVIFLQLFVDILIQRSIYYSKINEI